MTMARSVSIVAALVVAMILTRFLTQDYYGYYRKLWLIYMLLGPAFISASVGTLYYRGGVHENKSVPIYSAIFLSSVFSITIFLIAFIGADTFARLFNAPGLSMAIRGFSIYMLFSTFASLSEPVFVLIHRKRWLLYYNLTYNVIESLLIVIPFYLRLPLSEIVLIMSVGPFIRTIFIIWLVYTHSGDKPEWQQLKSEFHRSLSYSMGLFIMALAGMASVQIDKWVVSSYFSSDSMYAIYSVGARKIPFISALITSITSSLVVHYSDQLKKNDFKQILNAARQATDRLFLILVPVMLLLFIYSREIMILLFQKYADSAPVFQIYIGILVSQFFFAQSVILGKGLSKINAWIGIIEVVLNLILSLILIRTFGLLGPAIATLIAHWAFQLMIFGYCHHKFGIPVNEFLPTKKIIPLILTVPLVFIFSMGVKMIISSGLLSFIISSVMVVLILLVQYRYYSPLRAINRVSSDV